MSSEGPERSRGQRQQLWCGLACRSAACAASAWKTYTLTPSTCGSSDLGDRSLPHPFHQKGPLSQILWNDVLLRVTRLTDARQTSGKDNLTIQRLPDIRELGELARGKVEEQVDVAVHAADAARRHRNQRISHKDLAYAIGGSELPSSSLGQIRRALDTVHGVLQTVNMGVVPPAVDLRERRLVL